MRFLFALLLLAASLGSVASQVKAPLSAKPKDLNPSVVSTSCGGAGVIISDIRHALDGSVAFRLNVGTAPTASCNVQLRPLNFLGFVCTVRSAENSSIEFVQKQTATTNGEVVLRNFDEHGTLVSPVSSSEWYVICRQAKKRDYR
jgi:hypothetical protein